MIIKLTGAIIIFIGFGSIGYILSSTHKRAANTMQQLILALEFMERELQYRRMPLSSVFRRAAQDDGIIKEFFYALSEELEGQISPNVECCVIAALEEVKDLPDMVVQGVMKLGKCVGRFDLEGQIEGLASVHKECVTMLANHTMNQDTRLRRYQTLSLCIGAALVVFLF